ncbi:MAG: HEAT repeat domain-containing protein [Chloroflexi bacterium]|nr:HEAT repeat domain-containing protein [Chloroflexota bacterium]
MADAETKVIQFHISRLKDKNPEVLMKTIKELVKFGAKSKEALPHLETVFKSHPDVEVRKAAHAAGLHIYKQVQMSEDHQEPTEA